MINAVLRILATLTALGAPSAQPLGTPAPCLPERFAQCEDGMLAIDARHAADSIGVVTHLDWLDTPYGNAPRVMHALDYLGVHQVRDAVATWWTPPYEQLAAAGYRFVLHARGGNSSPGETAANAAVLARQYPGSVIGIEGPNEVNTWPVAFRGRQDLAAAAAYQKHLYAMVRTEPALTGVKVINLTLGGVGPNAYAPLGDLSPAVDAGNAHLYFYYGAWPSRNWNWGIKVGRISTPSRPEVVVTETGYSSAAGAREGVGEDAQARLILALVLTAMADGRQTFVYQLVDQAADPARRDLEKGFGLFRYNWTPKPAAAALRNLLALLRGGAGPNGAGSTRGEPTTSGLARNSRARLRFALAGADRNTRTVLLQRGDGHLFLAIWIEQKLWDPDLHKALPTTNRKLSLKIGEEIQAIAVHDPLRARRQALRPAASGGATQIMVGATPILIELAPASR